MLNFNQRHDEGYGSWDWSYSNHYGNWDTFEYDWYDDGSDGDLSAFTGNLTADPLYLERAHDLGKRLLGAFKTESGLPAPNINLRTRKPGSAHWSYNYCTAEMGSLALEFNRLSAATNDTRFAAAVKRVGDHLAEHARRVRPKHLLPIFFTPDGKPSKTDMTSLGARGDSYYEYLLKGWLQGGRQQPL